MFRKPVGREELLPFVRRPPTTNAILPVEDMAGAIEFYQRIGFQAEAYDDGYAWIKHCGWEWLHLRGVDSVEGNRASAYLHVGDADAWRRAMVASSGGAVELSEATDMPWGKREYSFTDPAGNLVRVGSSL